MNCANRGARLRLPASSRQHIGPFGLIVPVKTSDAAYIKADYGCRNLC